MQEYVGVGGGGLLNMHAHLTFKYKEHYMYVHKSNRVMTIDTLSL